MQDIWPSRWTLDEENGTILVGGIFASPDPVMIEPQPQFELRIKFEDLVVTPPSEVESG